MQGGDLAWLPFLPDKGRISGKTRHTAVIRLICLKPRGADALLSIVCPIGTLGPVHPPQQIRRVGPVLQPQDPL